MPIHYSRDTTRRRIDARSTGVIDVNEVLKFVEAQHADGAWHDAVLLDARGAETTISPTDARQIAARVKALSAAAGPRGPLAVVTRDPVVFGMNRMYGVYVEGTHVVGVFHDLPEAEEWLSGLRRES